jgi:hypothetical protein
MEKNDMVWKLNGMEWKWQWHVMERQGKEMQDKAWHGMEWEVKERKDTAWNENSLNGMARKDMA